jgi:O-methyltransferase
MLLEKIVQEISGVTIVPWKALQKLFQTCEKARDLPGSVAECGVYRGGTLRLIARALPNKTVWGFDTFVGMPDGAKECDVHKGGAFGDTSYEQVSEFLKDLGNVHLVQGMFPDTFVQIPPEEKFCLVHLDCDQYDSYKSALDFFLPRLVDGGFLVVDDYVDCEGSRKAVDERFPEIEKFPYVIQKMGEEYKTVVFRPNTVLCVNLGCGNSQKPAAEDTVWLNLDKIPHEGVDIVADLEEGLPFEDDSIDILYASHVLEHIKTFPSLIAECYRVLIPRGVLIIKVPFAFCRAAIADPTHVWQFVPETFFHFDRDSFIGYDTGGMKAKLNFAIVWNEVLAHYRPILDDGKPGGYFTEILVDMEKAGPLYEWEQKLLEARAEAEAEEKEPNV